VRGVQCNRCIMGKYFSLESYWLRGNGCGTLIHVNFQMEVYGHAEEYLEMSAASRTFYRFAP